MRWLITTAARSEDLAKLREDVEPFGAAVDEEPPIPLDDDEWVLQVEGAGRSSGEVVAVLVASLRRRPTGRPARRGSSVRCLRCCAGSEAPPEHTEHVDSCRAGSFVHFWAPARRLSLRFGTELARRAFRAVHGELGVCLLGLLHFLKVVDFGHDERSPTVGVDVRRAAALDAYEGVARAVHIMVAVPHRRLEVPKRPPS